MQIKELGHVVLYVTAIEKMAGFYRDTLGFRQISASGRVAAFSSGRTHHELLLIEIGGEPRHTHGAEPGLYHIGFKVGDSTEELRQVYHELRDKGVHIVGMSDHGVTHSLYILDPDGNELELYVDVSDVWKENPGAVMTPVQPLNLD
jgi:catechol 2,3-dioxygenase